jgi:drug/metabolite transporter (DMT)-like permease
LNFNLQTGMLLALPMLTGLCLALYEKLVILPGIRMSQVYLAYFIGSAVPLVIWGLFRGELTPAGFAPLVKEWPALTLYLALSMLISVGWWFCTSKKGVAVTASFESAYPAFALLFSVFVNRRLLRATEACGLALVMAGVMLLMRGSQ